MTHISERLLVQAHLDAKQPKVLSAAEEASLRTAIAAELKAQDAVLVAHFYCDPVIQALAEETGGCVSDSLEMARFGAAHPAKTVLVAGVRFMGEDRQDPHAGKTHPDADPGSHPAPWTWVAPWMSFLRSAINTPSAPWWCMPTPRRRSKPGRIGW